MVEGKPRCTKEILAKKHTSFRDAEEFYGNTPCPTHAVFLSALSPCL